MPITMFFRVCNGVRVRFAETQIVAGHDDDLVPWSNNQYFDDLLPNRVIHPLDAGHCAWEQRPEKYGSLVADWVADGYRRVAAS